MASPKAFRTNAFCGVGLAGVRFFFTLLPLLFFALLPVDEYDSLFLKAAPAGVRGLAAGAAAAAAGEWFRGERRGGGFVRERLGCGSAISTFELALAVCKLLTIAINALFCFTKSRTSSFCSSSIIFFFLMALFFF